MLINSNYRYLLSDNIEILKDKYNIEDLFKKRKNDLKKHSGEVELVKYKESIFKKICNMFRKIKYK